MTTKQARPHKPKVFKKKPTRAKKKKKEANTRFPMKPNYVGPNNGYFAMVHHMRLFENTSAFNGGIKERVDYVRKIKPSYEQKPRRDNMMYIGDMPELVFIARLEKANTSLLGHENIREVRFALRRAIEEFKVTIGPQVLKFIKKHNPTHRWDEKKNRIKGT